jgi:hypothetical protein
MWNVPDENTCFLRYERYYLVGSIPFVPMIHVYSSTQLVSKYNAPVFTCWLCVTESRDLKITVVLPDVLPLWHISYWTISIAV